MCRCVSKVCGEDVKCKCVKSLSVYLSERLLLPMKCGRALTKRKGASKTESRQMRLGMADAWIQVYPLRMVINYAIEPQMLWKVPDLFASQ